MAAYSTGASWSFPADVPGASEKETQQKQGTTTDASPQHEDDNVPTPPQEPKSEPAPTPTTESPPRRARTHYPPRQCRICLEVVHPTIRDDATMPQPESMRPLPHVVYESEDGRLLCPCKCKGSQKYVHEACLNAWRRADPTQKRNYWECPTCRYRYRLQRLTWSSWISSTSAQVALTLLIFLVSIFLLGFVADPIINLYLDPVDTIATRGGPTGSLIYEDEDATWLEHWIKGVASLGLLGFAKFMLTISPFYAFRTGRLGRSAAGGTGRDRLQQLGAFALLVGVCTFLFAVWKGVRAWSRKTLESAGERVLDVPGQTLEDEDD